MLEAQHPHPILSLVETAKEWGKPPSFWMGGGEAWTEHDKLLVHAVTLYRKTLCPTCGMPRAQCETSEWEVSTSICKPEAAVEVWRKQNPEPPPGIKVTPIPATVDAHTSAAAASAPEWVKQKHQS